MQFNGRLSGGTMATGILLDSAGDAIQSVRRDPYVLGGAPAVAEASVAGARGLGGGEGGAVDADPTTEEYDDDLGLWTAPFWMADIDSRVVRRTSSLFREAAAAATERKSTGAVCSTATQSSTAHGYGPHFAYRERALAADEGVARNLAASRLPPVEKRKKFVARGKLPSPGQGPSVEVRAKSWFRLFFWAERGATGEDGNAGGAAGVDGVLTSVEGGDPGYEETSKMVAEAALLMAMRRDELPWHRREGGGVGGVVTPAFGIGQPLIASLRNRGLRFVEHQLPDSPSEEGSGPGAAMYAAVAPAPVRAGALISHIAAQGAPSASRSAPDRV